MSEENNFDPSLFGVAPNSARIGGTTLCSSPGAVANQQRSRLGVVMDEIANIPHDANNDTGSQATGLESLLERPDAPEVDELRRQLEATTTREAELANEVTYLEDKLQEQAQAMEDKVAMLEAKFVVQAEQIEALLRMKARYEKKTKPIADWKPPKIEVETLKESVSNVYMTPGPNHRRRSADNRRKTMFDGINAAAEQFRRSSELGATEVPVPDNTTQAIMVNGEKVELVVQPHGNEKERVRMWDKTKRDSLSQDDLITWKKEATSYVLTKHNKLAIPDARPDDSKCLKAIRNHKLQLQLLAVHLHTYDVDNVLTIVVPKDVINSIELEGESYDLLRDHHRLSVEQVANSCAWYNRWTKQDYFRVNMQVIFECLQKNTDEALWNKALDDYNHYEYPHAGGPLMLALILDRQMKSNESALSSIATNLAKISIKDEPGEDVEAVCARIEAGHEGLVNASGKGYNYVPSEFPKQILNVLTTSSVGRFNKVFSDERTEIQKTAARNRTIPQWTPVPELLSIARRFYAAIRDDDDGGGWHASSRQQKKALIGSQGGGGDDPNSVSKPPSGNDRGCFNCEEEGHSVKQCDKTKNQKKINENYAKWKKGQFKTKPRSRANNVRKTKKGPDGTPLMLNKKNQWVTDQKALYLEKSKKEKEEAKSELMALVGGLCAPVKTETETVAPTTSETESKPAASSDLKVQQIQAAVAWMFK